MLRLIQKERYEEALFLLICREGEFSPAAGGRASPTSSKEMPHDRGLRT